MDKKFLPADGVSWLFVPKAMSAVPGHQIGDVVPTAHEPAALGQGTQVPPTRETSGGGMIPPPDHVDMPDA